MEIVIFFSHFPGTLTGPAVHAMIGDDKMKWRYGNE